MTYQNQKVTATPQGETEVTPEMVRVGVDAWWAWNGVGMESAAKVIYAAMEKEARRQAKLRSLDRLRFGKFGALVFPASRLM